MRTPSTQEIPGTFAYVPGRLDITTYTLDKHCGASNKVRMSGFAQLPHLGFLIKQVRLAAITPYTGVRIETPCAPAY